MGKPSKSIHLLTSDASLLSAVRAAASELRGVQLTGASDPRELGPGADVLLIDSQLEGANAYEVCRSLTGRMRCPTFLLSEEESAEGLAHFCGGSGRLGRPPQAQELRSALEENPGRTLPSDSRGGAGSHLLPEALLRDLSGEVHHALVDALTDPETNLFNYAFLNYKIDEELKRAQRFGSALACLMLGFEGQASKPVLQELSGIFLQASRDTDILGRFDESSFLFLLPHTGPEGAAVMASRIRELAEERGLRDILGDPLRIHVGISFHPHPQVLRKEDLLGRAREAFLSDRGTGITA